MLPAFFRAIGSDRFLTPGEVSVTSDPQMAVAWDVYRTHFRGFTGSTLDPQFHRLTHTTTCIGNLRLDVGETVIVVGTGPSLARQIETLVRVRGHARIFTSPRGAEMLLAHGITPDLVLVEHQTPLDAYHSARHAADAGAGVLARCPLVAADWRTPPAMIAGLNPSSLFVPASLPTWGLWPATALAMAADAGASRLALLGIDLGTSDAPDPAQAPLRALLELLASLMIGTRMDCGQGGTAKEGWPQASLAEAAGARVCARLEVRRWPAPSQVQRVHESRCALARLEPVMERAIALRSRALEARSRGGSVPTRTLPRGIEEALGWANDPRVRVPLQESLGISFLPRFWRTGIDLSLGHALWRPLLLATHELTAQAGVLKKTVAMARAA